MYVFRKRKFAKEDFKTSIHKAVSKQYHKAGGWGSWSCTYMNIEMPKKLYCTRSAGEFLKVASTNLHAARGAERVHQESTQLQVYTFLYT